MAQHLFTEKKRERYLAEVKTTSSVALQHRGHRRTGEARTVSHLYPPKDLI